MMGRGALAGAKLASERRKRTLKLQKEALQKASHFVPKPPQIMVIKGRINLLSLSTVVIVMGFFVFAIGVVISMFAYEYVQVSIGNNNSSSSSTMDGDIGLAFLAHSDFQRTFQLTGPLILGLGVFTMLCGITALLEDRDKKTKRIIIREPSEELKPGSSPGIGPISGTSQYRGYTVSPQECRPGAMLSPRTVGSCPDLRYQPSSPVHLNPSRGYMQAMPSPVPVRDLYRFQPVDCEGETLTLT
ncbi:transmembrane protein 200B-like [Branchiostoma floridae]|uniref:Transmembrane protein 200B-like n=1 Tax=Branchiostoma floridae TaxID=7739 RepID=A0A9J7MHF5_BRAFL|nr:transmembrane protein 200B-like [Branchiostoma floridae]